MSFAWKGSIGPPVRKASKILESKAGNFPYGIVISSLPPFSNLWKMEFVFKKEKGKKKRISNQSALSNDGPANGALFPAFSSEIWKKKERKKGKRERKKGRKKVSRGTDEKWEKLMEPFLSSNQRGWKYRGRILLSAFCVEIRQIPR